MTEVTNRLCPQGQVTATHMSPLPATGGTLSVYKYGFWMSGSDKGKSRTGIKREGVEKEELAKSLRKRSSAPC